MKTLLNNLLILFLVLFSLQGLSQSDTSTKSKHPLLDKYYPRAETDTLVNTVLPKSIGVLRPTPVISQKAPENISGKKSIVPTPVVLPDPVKEDSILPVIVQGPVAVPNSNVKIESGTVSVPQSPVVLPTSIPEPVKEDSILPVIVQGPVAIPNSNVKIESGTVSVPQSPVVLPTSIPEPVKEDSVLPISTEAIGTPVSDAQMASEISPINSKKEITPTTKPASTAKAQEPKKKDVNPEPKYHRTRLGSSSPLYKTWEKNNNGAGSVTTLPKG